MKRLPKVRSGLAQLRLFRSTVRLGVMGSTVLTILLWTLVCAFALDFWIRMGHLERSIVLLSVIVTLIWTISRYLLPAMKVHESDTALAVMVDGMHGMHSDLVAAIQFDDEGRIQYGSSQLREMVVEYTGQAAGDLNFLEGFSRKEMAQRMAVFIVTAVVCLAPAAYFSEHTAAFLNRLVLGNARYPTRTIIEDITGKDVVAEGHSVTFKVRARVRSGEMPESGEVRIKTVSTGLATTVKLIPDDKDSDVYVGTLNRVLDDLSYTIYLGDARTDPRDLKLVPLPKAKLDLRITAPPYARGKVPPRPKDGRQAVVLEGSTIVPVVTADKELESAVLTVDGDTREFNLDRRGKSFELDRRDSPLAKVTEMVSFEIMVTDTDHLSPESPIKATVRISTDLPPRAALAAFSRYVVPTAKPEIRYKVIDDYALDHINLHVSIIDADGKQTDRSELLARLKDHRNDYRGAYPLHLEKLKLQKGYQVAVSVEAVDYRGKFEGKSRRSEKWIFEISDEAGVREAMDRLIEQMDKKLDEVLRAQLEAGK